MPMVSGLNKAQATMKQLTLLFSAAFAISLLVNS